VTGFMGELAQTERQGGREGGTHTRETDRQKDRDKRQRHREMARDKGLAHTEGECLDGDSRLDSAGDNGG
jgi:hypothetical protein